MAVFLSSVLTNVILARALGPTGRGVYTLALLVPSLMFLVVNLGIGNAIIYYLGKRRFTVEDIVGQSMSLSLILGGLAWAITFVLMRLFGSSIVPGVPLVYVLVASLGIPITLFFNFVQFAFQGRERFVEFNLVVLISYGAQMLLVVVTVVVLHGGVLGAVLAWTLSVLPTGAGALLLVRGLGRITFKVNLDSYRTLIGFGIVGYLSNLTTFLNYRFDSFLVNIFAGARAVGLYAVGVGMVETIWYLSTAAATVLAPRVTVGDPIESDRVTASMSRIVLFLSGLAAAGLALLSSIIVPLLFGRQFSPSTVAVWLLLPGIIALSVAKILTSYLLGRNQLRIDLLASASGLVLTLAFDLALIPPYGFAGAAVASSLAYIATVIVQTAWVLRNSTISLPELLILNRQDIARMRRHLPGWIPAA